MNAPPIAWIRYGTSRKGWRWDPPFARCCPDGHVTVLGGLATCWCAEHGSMSRQGEEIVNGTEAAA